MSESKVVAACLDYLRIKNIFAYRQNSGAMKTEAGGFIRFGSVGAPDIIAVIKGKYVGIECKFRNGKQSQNQKNFQEDLEKAGGRYLLVYGVDELAEKL